MSVALGWTEERHRDAARRGEAPRPGPHPWGLGFVFRVRVRYGGGRCPRWRFFEGKQCPEAKCPTSIRRARRGQSERAVRRYSVLISSSRKYFMATQMSRDLCPVASCDFAASKRYHDLFLFPPHPFTLSPRCNNLMISGWTSENESVFCRGTDL